MDLHEIQAQLEMDMAARGEARFLATIQRHQIDGMEADTHYGKALVAKAATNVAAAIEAWKADMAAGSARRHGTAYPLISGIDSKVLAVVALRACLSRMTSSETRRTRLIMECGMAVEDEARLAYFESQVSGGLVQAVREGIRKRGTEHFRRHYARRVVMQKTDWVDWTDNMHAQVGGYLLNTVMEVTGLLAEENRRFGRSASKNATYIVPTPALLEWVRGSVDAAKMMRPDYEPMVVPPLEWAPGQRGGYLTDAVRSLPLVKGASRGLDAELAEREMPVVYAALNAIQNTAWQVNPRVLDVMQQAWKLNAKLECMPSREARELPPVPVDMDTNAEARREWKVKAHAVHRQNASLIGRRLQFARVLDCANRYAGFGQMYFPHQLDFRGRVYAVTILSPQGSDNCKGLLRFAEGKALGDSGITWLAIHGANLAGVDKVSYQDRVTWVEENTDLIIRCAQDPFNHREWTEMDSPWQFLAFCFEWEGVIREGENYVSHLPVAMDGSCSGLQHFSAMLRDPVGGAAVNLVPQDKPADVYGSVAAEVNARLQRDVAGTDEVLAAHAREWLHYGVDRKVCKRSVMTLAYGSKQFGFAEQIMEDTVKPAIDECVRIHGAVDLDVVPWVDPTKACHYLAKLIWEAVNEVLVAAGHAMKWLQQVARTIAKSGVPVTWSTPTGFKVQQGYMDTALRQVKLTLGTRTVKLVLNDRLDTINKRKQESSIAPNFVHSCDASHLMLTVARGAEAGIANFAVIHDSFGTHAADSQDLFTVVRAAMVEMYETVDVIEQFRLDAIDQVGEELADEIPECPHKGTLDLASINESLYCFA